jgi:23S rRNA (uracil1939-C5)-methyltransferase
VVVGFRERAAPFVADLTRCEILAPPLDALIAPLGEMLTALDIRAQVPQIEIAVADNATALVFRVLSAPSAGDIERLREFGRRFEVQIHLQEGGIDSVAPLGDAAPLIYRLPDYGLELCFRPTDFIQVNAGINRRMIARAIDLLGPQPHDEVLDLYCGLGNFTLPLARRAARVVGIEGEAALIEPGCCWIRRASAQAMRCCACSSTAGPGASSIFPAMRAASRATAASWSPSSVFNSKPRA